MDVNISFKRLATAVLYSRFCIPALAQSDPAPDRDRGVTSQAISASAMKPWDFFRADDGSESLRLFRHANPLWNFANARDL